MVRPCKYASAEERLAARRLQNSRNVKAWRNRKKGTKAGSGTGSPRGSESSGDENQVVASNTGPSGYGAKTSSSAQTTRRPAASTRTSSRKTTTTSNTSTLVARREPWDMLPEDVHPVLASNRKQSRKIEWDRLLGAPSGVFDMNNISGLQPIDLMFGFSEALMDQYSSETDLSGIGSCDWSRLRSMQAGLQTKDKLMELSVLGSASQYLARVSGDPNMLRLSYEMYQKTLQALRRRIKDGSAVKDGVVVGIANNSVLTIEVMEAASAGTPEKREWKAGLRAGARMAYRAGPRTFRSKIGLSVLRSLQSKYHLFALGDGEPVLFEGRDWESLPYEHEGKERMDELFHIINAVIKVLWRVRSFLALHGVTEDNQHTPEAMVAAEDLWEDISNARTSMSAWFLNVELDNEGELYTVVPAGTLYNLDGTVVTTALDFVSKEVATNLHFYWFYELILLQSALKVQPFLSLESHPIASHLPASAPDTCALLIIQSTEYFCRHLETLGTALTWFAFVCLRFTMLHLADYATTSHRHRSLLTWTYRATEIARNKHFLGRKGRFVVDSIWGTIDEVIPGLQALLLDEGYGEYHTSTEEIELDVSQICPEDFERTQQSIGNLPEEDNAYGFRFQWQQHDISFGERTSVERKKTPTTFAAGAYATIGQTYEEARWEELRRESSNESAEEDMLENAIEISLEEMSPNIDPALIDPDLELCDTNFLPVKQIENQDTYQSRRIQEADQRTQHTQDTRCPSHATTPALSRSGSAESTGNSTPRWTDVCIGGGDADTAIRGMNEMTPKGFEVLFA